MDPVTIAVSLIELVLKLVQPDKAKQLLDQKVIEAANLAADLAEEEKFRNAFLGQS